jgi:PAS domain S-box-containing protein
MLISMLGQGAQPAIQRQSLLLDSNLSVKAASLSFYSVFQLKSDEILGKKLEDLGDGQWNIPALLKLLRGLPGGEGEFDDFETKCDFPLLGPRRVSLSGRRLPAFGSQQTGLILLSIQDASGPLMRFPSALASIGDAVIVTDLESRIIFMNATAERLTGWGGKNALNRFLPDVLHVVNEQSVEVENPIEKALQAGHAVGFSDHAILINRDGSRYPIDDSAAPMWDDAGRMTGAVLIFRDISSRRKAEQELERSEARYRRLFESAHDGILILDAESAKVVDVNPFMSKLLGYPREHFMGKELWEIGVYKDAAAAKAAMETLKKVGQIRYEDHPLQHADGRHIPVEFVSNVYREVDRQVIQCNIRDITERTHQAAELAQAREAAEAASRSKSDFLANMSHEIRTPMTAILGFTEMLLNKSPEECKQVGCVQIIRRNASHLLELINDILDLSKVEAGQMKVERIPCNLPALLSEILSLMRPRAEEKGLGFDVTFDGPIPRLIQTDPARLRQILVNLIGNALKFTESGKIDLRIKEEMPDGPNFVLRIDVIDSGIGMTPEQMRRLFRPFTQGDESITRKFGGTGLGLTISAQLAKLLGGDVTVVSELGRGSTFTVKIDGGPSALVERLSSLTEGNLSMIVEQRMPAEVYLRGRILLAEDGADNQRLLCMQLSGAGASVSSALNGQIAVDMATTEPFDLILMDMQMPVMDGFKATIELRRRGLTIPIIALTAYAMAEDREKCMASGCTAYLSKPIDEETLLTTVNAFLGKPMPQDTGRSIAAAPSASTSTGAGLDRIKSSLAGNARMMEIIPGYVNRLPDKVRKMHDTLEHHDLAGLLKEVHDLAGTAGGYGFAALTQPAQNAQESIRNGADLKPLTAEIDLLIGIIRQIEGYDESKAIGTLEKLTK